MAADETPVAEAPEDKAPAAGKGHPDSSWWDEPDEGDDRPEVSVREARRASPPGDDASVEDWKAYARAWESLAKKEPSARKTKAAEKRAQELEQRLKEFEDRDKSEHEKALEKAREQAKQEVMTEVEKDRRQDRLENASTRLAAKGFQIGDGDDAQSVKFADPEDAFDYVERAIRKGDIDEADIFDEDGKVQTSALQAALADILDSKPHLRSSDNGKPKGNPDTRRGTAVDRDLEAMTPEDHARRKYPGNK